MGRRLPSAVAVASGILLSRLLGLARERVIAHYLGNSVVAGALRAALRIPNLLQNLFGEGVLSASFIPVYAKLLAENDQPRAKAVAGSVFLMLLTIVAATVAIGVGFGEQLVDMLAPGFESDTRQLTARLVRILFPATGLLVLSAWCLGILNSHRRFFLSYVAPALWNLAIIAALFVGAGLLSGGAEARMSALVIWAAWGVVAGSALQFLVQLPQTLTLNGGFGVSRDAFRTAGNAWKDVRRNFGPALIARGVVQLSAYVDQVLSSYLGPAMVSALAYTQTLYLLPISLFGMAVSAAELPQMASATGTSDEVKAAIQARLAPALARVTFFIVPTAVAFLTLGDVIAATLLQTGQFRHGDATLIWGMLAASGCGLLANVHTRLLVSSLWATKETVLPMRVAILRVALGCLLGLGVVFPLRAALALSDDMAAIGLNAAAAVVAWAELALDRTLVRRRLGGVPTIGGVTMRCALAAVVAAAGASTLRLASVLETWPAWLRGGLILGLFGLIYVLAAMVLKVEVAARLLAKVRRSR